MKRRNFISMLAGLLAVPAAIKGLFDKQDFSIVYGQHFGKTGRGRLSKEEIEDFINDPRLNRFHTYNEGYDEDAIEAMVTGGKKDFVPLPTFGKNKLPKHLKHLCA
ncbi:MAG TPA: hypothetical protein VMV77_16740 [Bacteroidales bacterium]|nr:hypothetical protein [Bacteroidales bacterium]